MHLTLYCRVLSSELWHTPHIEKQTLIPETLGRKAVELYTPKLPYKPSTHSRGGGRTLGGYGPRRHGNGAGHPTPEALRVPSKSIYLAHAYVHTYIYIYICIRVYVNIDR